MSGIYFYDDEIARTFEPFSLTRPACTLRVGGELTFRRWEAVSGLRSEGFIGSAHLGNFCEGGSPSFASGPIPAGSLVVNSRFVPSLGARIEGNAFLNAGRMCAVRIGTPLETSTTDSGALPLDQLSDHEPAEIEGRWLDDIWDIVGSLSVQLIDDIPNLARGLTPLDPGAFSIVGDGEVFCAAGVRIDPQVVFDTSAGPIFIGRGTSIASFSRLVGPLYIGEGSTVMGDSISGCSIGDHCKVRGEISNSVMIGQSNKGHTGFVGHSYLGRWVNLGSGTTTSNLKNTYGTVQLWTPGGLRDTGLQFLGTIFGDHVKTGIGMMLTTGTVIGAGASIHGSSTPPKVVPPFAWGDGAPYDTYAEEKFIEVAERVMARRHVTLNDQGRRGISDAFAARWSA